MQTPNYPLKSITTEQCRRFKRRDVVRLLGRAGFTQRNGGKHAVYDCPHGIDTVTLSYGNDLDVRQVKQAVSAVERAEARTRAMTAGVSKGTETLEYYVALTVTPGKPASEYAQFLGLRIESSHGMLDGLVRRGLAVKKRRERDKRVIWFPAVESAGMQPEPEEVPEPAAENRAEEPEPVPEPEPLPEPEGPPQPAVTVTTPDVAVVTTDPLLLFKLKLEAMEVAHKQAELDVEELQAMLEETTKRRDRLRGKLRKVEKALKSLHEVFDGE